MYIIKHSNIYVKQKISFVRPSYLHTGVKHTSNFNRYTTLLKATFQFNRARKPLDRVGVECFIVQTLPALPTYMYKGNRT